MCHKNVTKCGKTVGKVWQKRKKRDREIFQVFQTDSMALVNFLDYQNQRRFA